MQYMRARRSGGLVDLSSGSGVRARKVMGAYTARRGVLNSRCHYTGWKAMASSADMGAKISTSLARTVAECGVRVLMVYVGPFDNAMVTRGNLRQHHLTPI